MYLLYNYKYLNHLKVDLVWEHRFHQLEDTFSTISQLTGLAFHFTLLDRNRVHVYLSTTHVYFLTSQGSDKQMLIIRKESISLEHCNMTFYFIFTYRHSNIIRVLYVIATTSKFMIGIGQNIMIHTVLTIYQISVHIKSL